MRAQCLMARATKPEDLSSIPGPHGGRREPTHTSCLSTPLAHSDMPVHTGTCKINTTVIKKLESLRRRTSGYVCEGISREGQLQRDGPP